MRVKAKGLVAATLLVALSCAGLDNFIIEERSRATIQRGSILEQFVGAAGFSELATLDLTQNQTLQNQGVQRSQIDSVKIQTITLTIVEPASGQDFTFLDTIEFFVEAPNLPKISIATGGPFAADARVVSLTVADRELADYAAAESMSITTDVRGRRPELDVTIEAELTLDVDVDVDGAACGG